MKFGIMYDFRNPERWHIPEPVFYQAMLDQMIDAEKLGFDHIWLTEHHFTEDAYNPASLSMAAAIAAARSPALGEALGLDGKSRVLAIGTEGATDPVIYARFVSQA